MRKKRVKEMGEGTRIGSKWQRKRRGNGVKWSEMGIRPFMGETVEGIKNAQIRSTGSMRSTGSGSFAKNPENHRKIRKNIRGQRKIPKNPKKIWLNLQL